MIMKILFVTFIDVNNKSKSWSIEKDIWTNEYF